MRRIEIILIMLCAVIAAKAQIDEVVH